MRPLKFEYTERIEPEDVSVRGNVMASGDDEADKRAEDAIIARLDRGDVSAWCGVIVEATTTHDGATFKGSASIWCCSYASEQEALDAHRDDLQREARADLKRALELAIARGVTAERALKRFPRKG